MKSPFPGMDPYLESRWPDVHSKLIAFMSEAIQGSLPDPLRARSEERVLVEVEDKDEKEPRHAATYAADIAVVDLGPKHPRRDQYAQQSGGTAVAEPVHMKFYEAPETERVIYIIDRTNGNKVVTAIEILSPWNKASGRLNKDLKKVRDYEDAGVSFVEIDLLRYPDRSHMRFDAGDLAPERRTPYFISVGDAQNYGEWAVYSVSLRTPLPTIPIPLRRQDKPVMLDLQPLLERVYKAGGHDDIDYTKPLDPPLSPEDTQWADHLLRAAGKRP